LNNSELIIKANELLEKSEQNIFSDLDEKYESTSIINTLYRENICLHTNENNSVCETIISYLDNGLFINDNCYIKKISNILYYSRNHRTFMKYLDNIKEKIKKYIIDNYNVPQSLHLERNFIFPFDDHYPIFHYINNEHTNNEHINNEYTNNEYIHDEHTNNDDVKLVVEQDVIDNMKTFNFNKNIHENYDKCIICYENFVENDIIFDIPCNHFFHKSCLSKWLKNHSYKCPICKEKIANYVNK